MKPFNLEEALAGKICVTRDGRIALITFDKTQLNIETDFPIVGYICEQGVWSNSEYEWGKEGNYSLAGKSRSDLVGMWEEPQPEVTVTVPAPLKEVIEGQAAWYYGYGSIPNINIFETSFHNILFNPDNNFYQYLLETGQLFATKEDAEAFLEAMKGARR